MRPEDVRTSEDFQRYLAQQQAELAEQYRTPTWERAIMWAALILAGLVAVLGVVAMVKP